MQDFSILTNSIPVLPVGGRDQVRLRDQVRPRRLSDGAPDEGPARLPLLQRRPAAADHARAELPVARGPPQSPLEAVLRQQAPALRRPGVSYLLPEEVMIFEFPQARLSIQ